MSRLSDCRKLGVGSKAAAAANKPGLPTPTSIARGPWNETTRAHANHSLICGPWRLKQATVEKPRGETGQRTARLAAQTRQTGDLNYGFHEAEIAVKQISKRPIYWGFFKISMKANFLKTMATASNYRPCGEECGENCGTQKEASNG
jgi:hypothetical protein